MSAMFYFFSRELLRVGYRCLGGVTAVGGDKVPRRGGVILAPNHISYADPPLVGIGTKRQVHFMAKEELFESKCLDWWMHGVGTFPVKRGSADRKALKHAIDLLGQGRVVCVFPEGTRSPDGKLQDPELGIGLIAVKSRAPIVPVAIVGTDKVLGSGDKGLHKHHMYITYGEPLTFADLCDSSDTRHAMEEIGRRVMAAIADLLSGADQAAGNGDA